MEGVAEDVGKRETQEDENDVANLQTRSERVGGEEVDGQRVRGRISRRAERR